MEDSALNVIETLTRILVDVMSAASTERSNCMFEWGGGREGSGGSGRFYSIGGALPLMQTRATVTDVIDRAL